MIRRLFRRCAWCWHRGNVEVELERRRGGVETLHLCVKHGALLADIAGLGAPEVSTRAIDKDQIEINFTSLR